MSNSCTCTLLCMALSNYLSKISLHYFMLCDFSFQDMAIWLRYSCDPYFFMQSYHYHFTIESSRTRIVTLGLAWLCRKCLSTYRMIDIILDNDILMQILRQVNLSQKIKVCEQVDQGSFDQWTQIQSSVALLFMTLQMDWI